MTILERVRGERGWAHDTRQALQDLPSSLPALGRRRTSPVAQALGRVGEVTRRTGDAASAAMGDAAAAVTGAVGGAADATTGAVDGVATAAGDAVARVSDLAARTTGDLGRELARAGRGLRLDRGDEVVAWVREQVPPSRLDTIVSSLERELPDTDRDRYDRAFDRGRARARSAFIGLGLLVGAVAGVAGAVLLDPKHGKRRRTMIVGRARRIGRDATRRASDRAERLAVRARGVAAERGLVDRNPALVPVMDPAATRDARESVTPVTPLAAGAMTGPTSTEREPFMEPEGGHAVPERGDGVPVSANVAARSGALEPDDGALAGEGDRGDWHRTI